MTSWAAKSPGSVDGQKPPGSYAVEFDASALASGLYVYRLTAGSYTQTRKMMLVR